MAPILNSFYRFLTKITEISAPSKAFRSMVQKDNVAETPQSNSGVITAQKVVGPQAKSSTTNWQCNQQGILKKCKQLS